MKDHNEEVSGALANENLGLWQSVEDIDPKHTKPITGKDYRGTSPDPQYLIKLMTEKFGPAGEGFGWEVKAEAFERLSETDVIHWCRISFWHKDRDGGQARHESYGQTKAAYKTSKGYIKVDEDAPKKSLTDAVTKAASHLGFAANIFLGLWDDSKYVSALNDEYRAAESPKTPPVDASSEFERMKRAIAREDSLDGLTVMWRAEKSALDALKDAEPRAYDGVRKAFAEHAESLKKSSESVLPDDEIPF